MTLKIKIIRVAAYLFLGILFAAFLGTVLYYSEVKTLMAREIQTYGAIGCLLGGFIVDALINPLGPEWPVVAGILSGVKPQTAFLMTSVGSMAATLMVYWVGYAFGAVGAHEIFKLEHYDRVRRTFILHRRLTMVIAALTPVPYVPFCLIAGIFKMRQWEYFVFAIIPRFIRIGTVAYITFLLRSAL